MSKVRTRVSGDVHHEIEQFLFDEAALLDHRRYEDWYAVLAEDLRYFMPVRSNREAGDRDHEFSNDREVAHFDDTRESMRIRIKRLRTGKAWSEQPPSRTRHLISNVRAWQVDRDARLFEVHSAFHVYRSRLEREVDQYAGERIDLLRRTANAHGWEIARRTIHLDQTTILSSNISIFF